jgi:hypothetical protein
MPRTIDEIDNDLLRIKIIAGAIAAILLGVTGFTVYQLPFKIQEAVNKKITDDIVREYRNAAQKAAADAAAAAARASQVVTELEETKSRYSRELSELDNKLMQFRQELDKKVSLNTQYIIMSMKGPYFVGIQGTPTHGGPVTLGSQATTIDDPGVRWKILDRWPW